MSDVRSSIQLAAKRSGLSAHVIRMWEKRYEAVTPGRTDTKRRLYSDEDIQRLTLLREVTSAGHRIGDVARLSTSQLRGLVEQSRPAAATAEARGTPPAAEACVAAAVAATGRLAAAELEAALEEAAVSFGTHGMLQLVVGPLAHQIGELWADGSITAAHEHFASGVISSFLQRRFHTYAESAASPVLIVVTPAGQLHELGAHAIAAAARDVGWRVIYLGANLPAPEIAGAAISRKARAVALSIVYPGDDDALNDELRFLRRLLPREIALLAGGRMVSAYKSTLESIGADVGDSLDDFLAILGRLRSTSPGNG